MENVHASMIDAAKEITVTVLREDKAILDHDVTNPDTALDQTKRRVADLYSTIFEQVRASYYKRGGAKQPASVN